MIRLTVITVVKNLVLADRVAKFRQCVESVHAQKCRDEIEHLVVDGASDDGTEDLLREYAERGWIEVVTKPDHSVYEAMNNGLERARGQYVLFLNSDDYLVNRSGLAKALREMDAAGAEYCFGDVDSLDCEGRFAAVWPGSIDGLPFATNYCHQSMIVTTAVLREYGGFDLDYKVSSDGDLMLRLFKENRRYIHSSHVFAGYRSGGLSTCNRATAQNDYARSFHKYFGKDAGLSLDDCRNLWDYTVLRNGDLELARSYVGKLPSPKWRQRLEAKIAEFERLVEGRPPRRLPWTFIMEGWKDGGFRCIFKIVERRLRKCMTR